MWRKVVSEIGMGEHSPPQFGQGICRWAKDSSTGNTIPHSSFTHCKRTSICRFLIMGKCGNSARKYVCGAFGSWGYRRQDHGSRVCFGALAGVVAGIPPGCGLLFHGYRGCRCAQPSGYLLPSVRLTAYPESDVLTLGSSAFAGQGIFLNCLNLSSIPRLASGSGS
jgi:hypothetical protein